MRFPKPIPVVMLVMGMAALNVPGCNSLPAQPNDVHKVKALLDPLRQHFEAAAFEEHYVSTFAGTTPIRLGEDSDFDSKMTIALFTPKGFFCWHGMRDSGVIPPVELKEKTGPTRLVAFDQAGIPLYQVSTAPWCGLALLDADGDSGSTEVILWSEVCTAFIPAHLVILRLTPDGCIPMLILELNRKAMKARFQVKEVIKEGADGPSVEYDVTELLGPEKSGRWRFEKAGDGYNAVIIEEKKDQTYEKVAAFSYDRRSKQWKGPDGSERELWKVGGDPWIQAEVVKFSDIPPGVKLTAEGFGALRLPADHRKAAEDAAKQSGLK
jgi:hypothetical protein